MKTICDPVIPWTELVFRARELNGPWRGMLAEMTDSGFVHKYARGLFGRGRGGSLGAIMAVLYRCPVAIASLDSALWIHRVIRDHPTTIWISLPHHARKPDLPPLEIEALRFKETPHQEDITWTKILRDGRYPFFTLAKTAVDFIRARNRIGEELAYARVDSLVPSLVTVEAFRSCAARYHASYPVERYLRRMRRLSAQALQIQSP